MSDQIYLELISNECESPQHYCKDCGKDCMEDPKDYYMIRFDLWDQYGVGREMLCMDCMEIRLGRKLTADDIFPCPLTRRFNPYTKSILEQNENLVNGDTSDRPE